MSAPWWHPEANPLRDIQEFVREAEQAEQVWHPPPFQPVLPDWWPPDWPGGST